MIAAPGYATTHIYRSPFPRSSDIVNLRPSASPRPTGTRRAIVTMSRPRGYFDPARDKMAFDGQSPPPGAVPGAGVASSQDQAVPVRWRAPSWPNSMANAWSAAPGRRPRTM